MLPSAPVFVGRCSDQAKVLTQVLVVMCESLVDARKRYVGASLLVYEKRLTREVKFLSDVRKRLIEPKRLTQRQRNYVLYIVRSRCSGLEPFLTGGQGDLF